MARQWKSRTKVRIGDQLITELIDLEDNKWYPFAFLIQKILCRPEKPSVYRGGDLWKYVDIMEYPSHDQAPNRLIKTYVISEKGCKELLKTYKVRNTHNTTETRYNMRRAGYYNACIFFHVRVPEENEPLLMNVTPSLKGYDTWSMICLEADNTISIGTQWRKCKECGYYYPNNENYFKGDKCLQCVGKNFACKDTVVQAIYEHPRGLNFLEKILNEKDDAVVGREFKKFMAFKDLKQVQEENHELIMNNLIRKVEKNNEG